MSNNRKSSSSRNSSTRTTNKAKMAASTKWTLLISVAFLAARMIFPEIMVILGSATNGLTILAVAGIILGFAANMYGKSVGDFVSMLFNGLTGKAATARRRPTRPVYVDPEDPFDDDDDDYSDVIAEEDEEEEEDILPKKPRTSNRHSKGVEDDPILGMLKRVSLTWDDVQEVRKDADGNWKVNLKLPAEAVKLKVADNQVIRRDDDGNWEFVSDSSK